MSYVNFEPLDEYQDIMLKEFFTPESRKKIVKMATIIFKKRYGKTPSITKLMINWAISDASDRGRWKQNTSVHNLQLCAAERLVERMVDMDYDTNLNWFDVQEQLRDQEVTTPCGSHFIDRQKVWSPNII